MITIRNIRKSDDARIAEIIRNIFDEYDMPKVHTVYDDPDTDRQFELFDAESKSELWIAEEDGLILGSCGAYPTEGLPAGWCEIVKFYMDKRSRGKGIGTKLFAKALESAKHLGYTTAYLETFPQFGNAVGMYERFGFKRIDHQMGHSGHTATSIWMTKELTD